MKKIFRICIAMAFAALLAVLVSSCTNTVEIIADGTCGGEGDGSTLRGRLITMER